MISGVSAFDLPFLQQFEILLLHSQLLFFIGRGKVLLLIFVLNEISVAVRIRISIACPTGEFPSKSFAEKRERDQLFEATIPRSLTTLAVVWSRRIDVDVLRVVHRRRRRLR